MNLKYELVNILFANKIIEMKNNSISIASNELNDRIAAFIQEKIEKYIRSTGQEVVIDNIESAINAFRWAKIIINENIMNIHFYGKELDTEDGISIILAISKNGNIIDYKIEE